MTSYKENKPRQRDARGRFVKADPKQETSNPTRTFNRIADGDEPTLDSVHNENLMTEFFIRIVVGAATLIIIFLIMWLLQGCKPQEKAIYIPLIKTVTVETMVRDTIIETELVEYYAERYTPDTTSHLSNEYAYSDAVISNGVLHHTLCTQPGASVQKDVQIKDVVRTEIDSIPYPVPVKEIEYVERELNFIEKFFMGMGIIATLGLALWIWKR